MVLTPDGRVLALDGKVTLDDNASFRQDHGRFADTRVHRPARGAGQGEAPQLRQARGRGRHHRQRRGPGHVHARRGGLRGRGSSAASRPANFLDIGGGASAEVMANGLEIVLSDPAVRSVFVNVFGGITAVRRGGQRHRVRGRAADGARRGGGPPDRRPSRRQQGGRGPADPGRTRRCRSSSRWTRWTARRAARPSWPPRREHEVAIFLTAESRILVQGITGSEGRKHGARMLAAGTKVVGGTNPKKAGTTVELNGVEVPVFGTVAETMAATGADVSVIFVPPRGHQDRRHGGDRRGDPAARSSSPRASRCTTRPSSGPTPSRRATRPGSSGRTAPASPPLASPTPGSSRLTSPPRARSAWCRSQAR